MKAQELLNDWNNNYEMLLSDCSVYGRTYEGKARIGSTEYSLYTFQDGSAIEFEFQGDDITNALVIFPKGA